MKGQINSTMILAIIACLLWASAFTGVKIGLAYSPPFQFAGIRFLLSGLIVLPFARLKFHDYLRIVKNHLGFILYLGLFQTFVQYSLFYKGLDYVPGALGAIIIGSAPLFIALAAHYSMPGDKMSWKKAAAITLGLSGIVLVSLRKGEISISEKYWFLGITLLILCNITSGVSNVIIARNRNKVPPLVLSSSSMILGGTMLFLFSMFFEKGQFSIYPVEYYGVLAWLSLLSSISISIWIILLGRKNVKVSNLNMWKFIIPIFGALLSWAVISEESPDIRSIAGMVLTGSSLFLLNYINRKGL